MGEGCSYEVRGSFGVGVWKAIWKWSLLSFAIGNGWGVKFWTDSWCGCDQLLWQVVRMHG